MFVCGKGARLELINMVAGDIIGCDAIEWLKMILWKLKMGFQYVLVCIGLYGKRRDQYSRKDSHYNSQHHHCCFIQLARVWEDHADGYRIIASLYFRSSSNKNLNQDIVRTLILRPSQSSSHCLVPRTSWVLEFTPQWRTRLHLLLRMVSGRDTKGRARSKSS